MFFLSPVKLMVVLVIALMVLGPDKLPKVASQAGALWGDLRRWRVRLESEVRTAFPDLPPVHEIAHAVRSPVTYLDRLADADDATKPAVTPLQEPSRDGEAATSAIEREQRGLSGAVLEVTVERGPTVAFAPLSPDPVSDPAMN
jgi:Sec-independent protein translocase protein TatA